MDEDGRALASRRLNVVDVLLVFWSCVWTRRLCLRAVIHALCRIVKQRARTVGGRSAAWPLRASPIMTVTAQDRASPIASLRERATTSQGERATTTQGN
jgi:hypothetical protein